MIKTPNSEVFRVEHVVHLKGYTFHCGCLEKTESSSIRVNDPVTCLIDSARRYQVSLNHTGVHVLNHALRQHFGAENAIIQTNSIVSDDHLKFEFKFNEMLYKPSVDDLTRVQKLCEEIVKRGVPVYTRDHVRLDVDDMSDLRYPVRKLNDVLYPLDIRVVSLGAEWDAFHK